MMNVNEIHGALEKNIDFETQSPSEVLTAVYGVMDSIDPVTCVHNIKEGLGLCVRAYDNGEWQPTENKMFTDDVYGALKKNIDLETQTPFGVATGLYESIDFMNPVTPVKPVKESLERYLRDNGIVPEHK